MPASLPRLNPVHALARRLGAAGVPGVRLYWPLAERLAPWPRVEHVRVGAAIPIVVSDRDDFIGANVYRGLYERAEGRLFPHLLRPGDLFVDVGANLGYYTAWGSRLVGPSGHVHAFEPSPRCFPPLERLVDAAQLDNVTLHRAAVGSASGHSRLYNVELATNSGAATMQARGPEGDRGVDIDVVRLDEIEAIRDAPEIGLLKIDTEGLEAEVLAGATSLFESARIRFALIEVSPEFGSVGYAVDLAADERYRAYAIYEAGIPRRTRLRPMTADDVGAAPKQFNLLLARADAEPAVSSFARR